MDKSDPVISESSISICTFVSSEALAGQLNQFLLRDRYSCLNFSRHDEFLSLVNDKRHEIDCLIFQETAELPVLAHELHLEATLLPTVILEGGKENSNQPIVQPEPYDHGASPDLKVSQAIYHKAEVRLPTDELQYLSGAVSRAINQFMNLATPSPDAVKDEMGVETSIEDARSVNWSSQAQSLSDIHGRLGYLGFFYKRSAAHFFRNLSPESQQSFLKELRVRYHEIISEYFHEESSVNQKIDLFVNMVFFADLPTAQVIEIHMELIEVLSHKLKVEGRDVDFLLSYRLALIDTIAHLCEMYRRSIRRTPWREEQSRE